MCFCCCPWVITPWADDDHDRVYVLNDGTITKSSRSLASMLEETKSNDSPATSTMGRSPQAAPPQH